MEPRPGRQRRPQPPLPWHRLAGPLAGGGAHRLEPLAAKRYLVETGSAWVRSWIVPTAGQAIIITELAVLEMFSLLDQLSAR